MMGYIGHGFYLTKLPLNHIVHERHGASVEVSVLSFFSICTVNMHILTIWSLKLPYEEALLDIITLGIFAFMIYLVF